jgi:hypothetical protein
VIGFGAVYPIAWDVRNDTGALVNASAVTLTITLPDGTTATPAVPAPTVAGQYRYDHQSAMAGRHTAHAVTTGPITVYDDEWDVSETPWMAIVSLADAKNQLNMDPGDHSADDELRQYVAGVTGAVENYLHETIVRQQVTDEIEVCQARRFRVWHSPAISLVSVVSWDGTQTWDVTRMRAARSGVVRVMAGPPVHGLVDVTLLAGYQVVPANYRQGALVVLEHVWETQRGQGTAMSGVIGVEERYRQPGEYFTIPNKAKEWLGPPKPVVA